MSKKTLIIIAAIIVLGFAGVSGVLLYNLYGPAGQTSSTLSESSFPQTLAGMSLAQVNTGEQAMVMISKLHGKDITIKQGFIAQYMSGSSQMTIWVSESNTEAEAVEMMRVMDEKMPASQVFKGRKEITAENQKVIYVTGMGQDHYYWQIGTEVYWIAVGGADSLQVLKDVIRSF